MNLKNRIVYFPEVNIKSWLNCDLPSLSSLVITTGTSTVCELGKQLVLTPI